ncbi:MAG: DUF756 domain-containing protein, partial [Actinobacteria bacterium]|nr:DUF756 domain-containing protein [Actinomycetota bacterium]
RHFAGSPETVVRAEVHTDHRAGRLRLRLSVGGRRDRRVVVKVADAYGPGRQISVQGSAHLTIDTRHSGGWYDIALSTPSDVAFGYQLAGRLESRARLTSDPQLGPQ